ncbi:hypothetical protein EV183_005004 [Coemansia sp. RSA 2336]|nr:hypothetical protein EV183_005004 [Coemansia sp. RSA 2336]
MPTPQSAVQDQLLPLDSFLQVPQWSTYNVANTVSTMPAAQTFQGDVLPGLEQLLMPVNQGNMALENINGLPQENTSTFVWSAISSSAIVNNPATNSMPAITAFTWPDLPENFAELGK